MRRRTEVTGRYITANRENLDRYYVPIAPGCALQGFPVVYTSFAPESTILESIEDIAARASLESFRAQIYSPMSVLGTET